MFVIFINKVKFYFSKLTLKTCRTEWKKPILGYNLLFKKYYNENEMTTVLKKGD